MFGLSALDVQKLAFELAEYLKLLQKFNKHAKCAERDWLFSFLKRNPVLNIRMPTATSIDRFKVFNKEAVGHFFVISKEILNSHGGVTSLKIWNVDDTGILNVRKSPKVIATKGIYQI